MHVTLRVLPHVWNLRSARSFRALRAALAVGADRFGMRVVEFAILGNHLHLIVEATDGRALSRGMQGLGVRIARGMNRVMARRGKVLADRFHAHVLRSPRETREAVSYVRTNHDIHAARQGRALLPGPDPYSSASGGHAVPLAAARTALLRNARAALGIAPSIGPPPTA